MANQDAAIAFYTDKLDFSLAADVPFGDGERRVEVAPPGGGTALALVPPRGDYQPGRMTGIALESADPAPTRGQLEAKGVDFDASGWAATARCRSCSSSAITAKTT